MTGLQCGIDNEKLPLEQYVLLQHQNGHPDLQVSPSGFIVNPSYSYFGSSPDEAHSDHEQPFGFVEIKDPYSVGETTLMKLPKVLDFAALSILLVKENHNQVQGQRAIDE